LLFIRARVGLHGKTLALMGNILCKESNPFPGKVLGKSFKYILLVMKTLHLRKKNFFPPLPSIPQPS
jgi:hypothetical protein